MRQQKGKKIVLSHPSPDSYILPNITTPSALNNRYQPQLQMKLKSQKISKHQIKVHSFDQACLRECCKRKMQIYQQNVAEATAKKCHFLLHNHPYPQTPISLKHHPKRKNNVPNKSNKRTLTQQQQARSKSKIYYLHNLKTFELQDIQQRLQQQLQERQTEHKVHQGRKQTKLLEWRDSFKKSQLNLKGDAKRQHKNELNSSGRQNEESSNRKGNDSYIQTDFVTSRINNQVGKETIDKQEDVKTNPTKRYYKYIQNYQNSEADNSYQLHRAMNSDNEDKKSVESYFKPTTRKENSTIFHTHKLKFSSSAKHSRVRSSQILTQTQMFKIPQTEEQQTQFLLTQKPLDSSFNLKQLVGKQNFKVLQQKDVIYFGLVVNDSKKGQGILLSQRQWFEGEFADDQKVKGTQKTKEGVYVGPFKNNKREGQGKFTWANGEVFEGEWKKGKKDGHGIWRSPKGDYYEGEWKNNKQNGKGLFTHVGGSKYNGYFKDFLKHGRGEQQFANGDKYSGEYKYGKPHGFGRYIWANGDKYEGQFVEGSREGKASGQSYQGSFLNDMKQGEGKERYPNGQYFQGQFESDGKVKGRLYSKKGVLLEEIS